MPVDLSGYIDYLYINNMNMSPGMTVVLCAAALLFIFICFFCSMCGFAVSASSTSSLKSALQNKNDKKTERALKIKLKSERYIGCAYTGVFINSAISLILLSELFCPILYGLFKNLPDNAAAVLSYTVVLVAYAVIFICFVCFIPKRIAELSAEKKLANNSIPFTILSAAFLPIVFVGSAVSGILLKVFGRGSSKNSDNPTEEKILMMVDEGEENGTIEENTKSMIENVFDFDDTTVGEIMTHRKDIVAVRDDDTISRLTKIAIESGRSRIPVYQNDIDNIIGVIYVKDLLKYVGVGGSDKCSAKEIIHKAIYVPESKSCSEMFKYMTANKIQIAVVVDEFGGTGGIITMEDLIESILGNIQDEYDNEDEDIERVNEYSFSVDGAMPLDEIEDLTGICFEGDQNDTIAGIMLDRMGHIPKDGEHPSIMINGTRFTVSEVSNRRISKVLVVKSHKGK